MLTEPSGSISIRVDAAIEPVGVVLNPRLVGRLVKDATPAILAYTRPVVQTAAPFVGQNAIEPMSSPLTTKSNAVEVVPLDLTNKYVAAVAFAEYCHWNALEEPLAAVPYNCEP